MKEGQQKIQLNEHNQCDFILLSDWPKDLNMYKSKLINMDFNPKQLFYINSEGGIQEIVIKDSTNFKSKLEKIIPKKIASQLEPGRRRERQSSSIIEKKDYPNIKKELDKWNLELGNAYGDGDCFYDAIALGLEAVGISIPVDSNQLGHKKLRIICKNYAREKENKENWKWLESAIKADIKTDGVKIAVCNNFDTYKIIIEYTQPEMDIKFNDSELKANEKNGSKDWVHQYAIWGRPHIEGKIICKKLNIKLHVIELIEHNKKIMISHQLIDGNKSESLGSVLEPKSIKDIFFDEKCISIFIYASHYVSVKKPRRIQMTKEQLDDLGILTQDLKQNGRQSNNEHQKKEEWETEQKKIKQIAEDAELAKKLQNSEDEKNSRIHTSIFDSKKMHSIDPMTSIKIIKTPKPTCSDGSCALHSVLGEWNGKEYKCNEIKNKQEKLAQAVKEKSKSKKKLEELIQTSIKELVMSEQTIAGTFWRKLRIKYRDFLKDENESYMERWENFSAILKNNEDIAKYIESACPENAHSFRYKFYSALPKKGGELYARILSLPEIHEKFQEYNYLSDIDFDWNAYIDTDELRKDYADFISTPRRWLLPSELGIIAHVFEKTIMYYSHPCCATPLEFNPGYTEVSVQFNGSNHYERLEVVCLKESTVPSLSIDMDCEEVKSKNDHLFEVNQKFKETQKIILNNDEKKGCSEEFTDVVIESKKLQVPSKPLQKISEKSNELESTDQIQELSVIDPKERFLNLFNLDHLIIMLEKRQASPEKQIGMIHSFGKERIIKLVEADKSRNDPEGLKKLLKILECNEEAIKKIKEWLDIGTKSLKGQNNYSFISSMSKDRFSTSFMTSELNF